MKRIIQWLDKECKNCSAAFKATDRNKLGLCNKCRMQRMNRLAREEFKKPYPLDKNAKKKRYCRIQRELNKAETREERRAIYAKELDFIFETGIWLWCVDRRDTPKRIQRSNVKGRKPLDQTDIKLKHPNTKDWYE